MNYVKRNNGSTLILVLLMMTVFSILFLSFASGSISNALQVKKTETSIQANSLSEMGALYHKNAAETELLSIVTSEAVKKKIDDEYTLKFGEIEISPENKEEYIEKYKNIVLKHWIAELNSMEIKEIELDEDNLFKISEHLVTHYEVDEKIYLKVSYTSTGNNLETEIPLEAEVNIPIQALLAKIELAEVDDPSKTGDNQNPEGGGGNDDSEGDDFPDGNLIEEPVDLNSCSGTNTSGVNCEQEGDFVVGSSFKNSVIKVTGDLILSGNANDSSGSTIWIEGDLNPINGNDNGNGNNNGKGNGNNNGNGNGNNNGSGNDDDGNFNGSSVKLHVKGNANFNGNVNGLNISKIEIHEDATFSKNVQNVNNTTIFIGQDATFKSQFTLNSNSIAYIGNDLYVHGNLTVNASSRLCVNGSINFSGNSLKGHSNIFARSSNIAGVITDDDEFEANCTVDGETPNSATKLIFIIVTSDISLEDFQSETRYNYSDD